MHYLAGVGLAFFLTLLMVSKQNKNRADYLLTAWLLIITIHLLLYYFFKTNQLPELLGWSLALPLVHGPFLYLYTRALTNRSPSVAISGIHFIPAAAIFLYTIPFLFSSKEEKLYVFEHQGAGYETFNLINGIAILLSGILYVILSSVVLQQHRKGIVQQFSSIDKINLQWLQYLIYWIGTIWIFVIFSYDDGVFGTTVLFILFIGIFGILRLEFFIIYRFRTTLPEYQPMWKRISQSIINQDCQPHNQRSFIINCGSSWKVKSRIAKVNSRWGSWPTDSIYKPTTFRR